MLSKKYDIDHSNLMGYNEESNKICFKKDVIWKTRTVLIVKYCLLMNVVKKKCVTSPQRHNLNISVWGELNIIAYTVIVKAVT